MELSLAAGAAALVALVAKLLRNRSFIVWFLGVGIGIAVLEIPLRFLLLLDGGVGIDPQTDRIAAAITVYGVLGGLALLLAFAVPTRPRAERDAADAARPITLPAPPLG